MRMRKHGPLYYSRRAALRVNINRLNTLSHMLIFAGELIRLRNSVLRWPPSLKVSRQVDKHVADVAYETRQPFLRPARGRVLNLRQFAAGNGHVYI